MSWVIAVLLMFKFKCSCALVTQVAGSPTMCDASVVREHQVSALCPAPSVTSLVCSQPVELFCRASNINITDPICFVKQKQETVEVLSQFLFTNMRSSAQRAQNENFSVINPGTLP